jgi:hypothetical protein
MATDTITPIPSMSLRLVSINSSNKKLSTPGSMRWLYLIHLPQTVPHLYHCSFSRDNISPSGWPVGFTLTTKHVWDAFTVACLLDDSTWLSSQLIIPNIGLQKDQFMKAMWARNLRFRLYSQPELSHQCDKCLQIFHGEEVWVVVVVDGVTVGHPCCAVHNCFEPLENQCNHFCSSHKKTEGRVCAIKGCTQIRQAHAR